MLSVTPQTVRRWEREGKITAFRSVGDTRYFTHEQYLALSGQSPKSESVPESCVIYARVSTRNQKDDLQNQIQFLRQFCNTRGMIVSKVYEDCGSGLNYKRKNWKPKCFNFCFHARGTDCPSVPDHALLQTIRPFRKTHSPVQCRTQRRREPSALKTIAADRTTGRKEKLAAIRCVCKEKRPKGSQ